MQIQALVLFASLAAALPPKPIVTSVAKARPAAPTTTPPAARIQPTTSTKLSSSTTKPSTTVVAISNAGNVAAAPTTSSAVVPMNQLTLPFANQPAFVDAMLDAHNTYRQRHGAANLTWNPNLVQGALAQLATQQFAHTTNNPYGENLASFYRNDYARPPVNNQNPRQQVQWWYDEVNVYNFSAPDYSHATGHFTQLVWLDTTQLGCAWDQLNGTDGGYTRRLTCEYWPKGNYLGQFGDKVLTPRGPVPAPQPTLL
ncbi:CAP domain-containing protein [Protomyces lactucae-debilis]|uniref:CAP domain-containing protein n=1 Tax=Protomyces lactucae-debilis TaxID=2754530 RepID=A0A1Y2FNS6_PROLT|nr:CAP domain-containing protein [Protomyces lactucae-debilis]ORY85660.1 CAP domain-containing protein [Protomyces lactucae-debilis]